MQTELLEKANELVQFGKKVGIEAKAIKLEDAAKYIPTHEFIVNSTSIGLKNESSPIPTRFNFRKINSL